MKKLKITYVIFCLALLFQSVNVGAASIEDKIDDLQRQINNLKKTMPQTANNKIELPFEVSGRLAVVNTIYKYDDDIENRETKLKNRSRVKSGRLGIYKDIEGFGLSIASNYNSDEGLKLYEANVTYNIGNNSFTIGYISGIDVFMENYKHGNAILVTDFDNVSNYTAPYSGIGVRYTYIDKFGGILLNILGEDSVNDESVSRHFVSAGNPDGEYVYNDNQNLTASARLYVTPIRTNDIVVHVGADAGFVNFKNSYSDLNDLVDIYVNRGNLRDPSVFLDKNYFYAYEFGFQFNSFTLESEGVISNYKYKDAFIYGAYPNVYYGANDYLQVKSFYVQASFVLTGEKREYIDGGTFNFINVSNPISKGGYGAFELVGKFSKTDTKDSLSNVVVDNFMEDSYTCTVGLNWFPVNNVQFLINGSKIHSDLLVKKNGSTGADFYKFNTEMRINF